MKGTPRPRPITVENLWLNQSLEERIKILQLVAPDRAKGLEMLLDAVLRESWDIPHGQPKDGAQ
jgi:hypothetical protein